MRINHLRLQNFKRFDNLTLNFPNEVTLIVGQNGSGKTTILQSIAALVGTATQELAAPSQLYWPGYNYERLQSNGQFLSAEADCSFSLEELRATKELYDIIAAARRLDTPPGDRLQATLRLQYREDRLEANSARSLYQFRGMSYAKQLPTPRGSDFSRIGSIYWYDEQRSSSSSRYAEMTNNLEGLRNFLISRYRFHQRIQFDNLQLPDDRRDYYAKLAELYHQVFQDRTFHGSEPHTDIRRPDWFFLFDGRKKYEVSEMSAGERAIFPLLIDFAHLHINNSIVLIDEIELHLHPPLQQAFLSALTSPAFGQNNQFIITTHSDYVAFMLEEANIIRL